MNARRLSLLAIVAIAALTLPAPAASGQQEFRMRVWMLPPMDVTGDDSCLTQGYHDDGTDYDNRALDWKSACGEGVSKVVRFRAVAATLDDIFGGTFAQAEPTPLPNAPCTQNTSVDYARVKVRSLWDNLVKGKMSYAHVDILATAPAYFNMFFSAGTFSTAAYNSFDVAQTVSDATAPVCWTGFHVHENNSNDAEWDAWNTSLYSGSPALCDCYQNNDRDNWTRRQTWVDQ